MLGGGPSAEVVAGRPLRATPDPPYACSTPDPHMHAGCLNLICVLDASARLPGCHAQVQTWEVEEERG